MKKLAYILSFYILLLSAVPCTDKPHDNKLLQTEVVHKTTHNHQKDSDHCSPFCACNCCVSSVIHQLYVIQFNCSYFVEESIAEYASAFVSSHLSSIWRPPKLS